jgi:hypothetical protein
VLIAGQAAKRQLLCNPVYTCTDANERGFDESANKPSFDEYLKVQLLGAT